MRLYTIFAALILTLNLISCQKKIQNYSCELDQKKVSFFQGELFLEGQVIEISIDSQIFYKDSFQEFYLHDRMELVKTLCTSKDSIIINFRLSSLDTMIRINLDGIDTIVFDSDFEGRPYIRKGPWPDA